jgi:hypothetical protein
MKRSHAALLLRMVSLDGHDHADAPNPVAWLRLRRPWPRDRRAAKEPMNSRRLICALWV